MTHSGGVAPPERGHSLALRGLAELQLRLGGDFLLQDLPALKAMQTCPHVIGKRGEAQLMLVKKSITPRARCGFGLSRWPRAFWRHSQSPDSTGLSVELGLRPGAAAADSIEKRGGAGQPSHCKEGEAADGFGGIELATHEALKALLWSLQLIVDHADDVLKALPQQGISEISLGFCKPFQPVALGHVRAAKPLQLWQHEPDPVTSFSAHCQLCESAVVDTWRAIVLSLEEAVEILVGHELNTLLSSDLVILQNVHHVRIEFH